MLMHTLRINSTICLFLTLRWAVAYMALSIHTWLARPHCILVHYFGGNVKYEKFVECHF